MGCTLIRFPQFEGEDGRLATVPRDNGANALALDGQGGGSEDMLASALREAPWFWASNSTSGRAATHLSTATPPIEKRQ